jgi:TolB-like protein
VRIVRDIIERRIFRFVIAYCAASWAGLELVDQLVGNELIPPVMYRAFLSLVICGLPGALIVSWFHGAKGRQEVPVIERWLLAGVALFAIGTTGFVARSGLTAEGSAAIMAELAPTQDPSRVAVLYMDARGGGDAEFLASGLTEALIDQLGSVTGLYVVSRNGAQLFRGRTAPPDSIGNTLQVGALVGGTVALAGDRVRVDVALTSSVTGEQIASRRLERPRAEIFALQDELADTVAVFLRQAIGREVGARTLRVSTRSIRAWEFVTQATQATDGAMVLASSGDMHSATQSLAAADSLLAAAEAADPLWVEPIVRRGWVAYRQARLGGTDQSHNEKWIATGLEHATRALAASPHNAGALELRATLGYLRRILNLAHTADEADRLLHDAEDGLRAAIAAANGRHASAQNSLAHLLINKGEMAQAKMNALQAYEMDPFLENAHLTIWRIFTSSWSMQDTRDAQKYCAEGMRRFPNDFRFRQCQLMLPALPGAQFDIPGAWAMLDEFTQASPPQVREVNRRRGMIYISMALARAGMADSARAVARSARAGTDIDPLRELSWLESVTWTWLGDTDEAVRQLSLWLSANPHALEGLRADATRRELPWYHRTLLDEPAFRSLVGIR